MANVIVKVIVVLLFMICNTRNHLVKGIGYAISVHAAIFLIHWLCLVLGAGEFFNQVIRLETQTSFGGSSYIPYRATGLFDEPSLFGMTILALIFTRYMLSGRLLSMKWPLITFSLPTMLVAVSYIFNENIKRKVVFKVIVVLFLVTSLAGLYKFAIDRESNVRMSPAGLRYTHVAFLLSSPNLLVGSGFCSAYGVFDLSMSRDELRNNYLGNFKDAGQVIYTLDRVGLIVFIGFCVLVVFTLGMRKSVLFFLYFALSKVPFIAVPSILLFVSMGMICGFSEDKQGGVDARKIG